MPHPELPPLPHVDLWPSDEPIVHDEAWYKESLLAWGQEVRRMALEEAAALCAKMASVRLGNLGATGLHLAGASIVNDRMRLTEGMHDCAAAIRALIEKQRTE